MSAVSGVWSQLSVSFRRPHANLSFSDSALPIHLSLRRSVSIHLSCHLQPLRSFIPRSKPILGRIACTESKTRPTVTGVPWSVCLFDIAMSCAKTDEPIEMPFGMWTRVSPRNHVLGGGAADPPGQAVIFGASLRCGLSAELFDHFFDSGTR